MFEHVIDKGPWDLHAIVRPTQILIIQLDSIPPLSAQKTMTPSEGTPKISNHHPSCWLWVKKLIQKKPTESIQISFAQSYRLILRYGNRRKFRSQISDNMQRWKGRGGKSQRGEVKKWEDQRGRKSEERRCRCAKKVGKSRCTAFFKWFGAPEGRKVTSLERRVRSQLARWNWDERWKIARRRGEKHICKQKAKNTSRPDPFWKLRCRKSARRCGAKHMSKSKVSKHQGFGPLFNVQMSTTTTTTTVVPHKAVAEVSE